MAVGYRTPTTVVNRAATVVINKPTGTAEGDLLVFLLQADAMSSFANPDASWTTLYNVANGATNNAVCAWKIAGASEPASYTFTTTGSAGNAAALVCLTGQATSTPIDTSLTTNNTTSSVTANAITTTQADDGILMVVHIANNSTTSGYSGTNPTFGEIVDVQETADYNSLAVAFGTKNDASTTGNRTATFTGGNANSVASLIAVKIAGGGGTSFTRTGSESVGVTDSRSIRIGMGRTSADNLGITDAILRTFGKRLTTSDNIGVTDGNKAVLSRVIFALASEVIGITDASNRIFRLFRYGYNEVGISDSLSMFRTISRLQGDSIGISDIAARIIAIARVVSESESVSDTIAYLLSRVVYATVLESMGVTDGRSVRFGHGRLSAESISASDGLARALYIYRKKIDDVGVIDVTVRAHAIAVAIAESLGLSDAIVASISQKVAYIISIAESIGITDQQVIALVLTAILRIVILLSPDCIDLGLPNDFVEISAANDTITITVDT